MKKCPYCAEKIKDEAIVCRYCGRDLPPKEIPVAPVRADATTKEFAPQDGNPPQAKKSGKKKRNIWLGVLGCLTACIVVPLLIFIYYVLRETFLPKIYLRDQGLVAYAWDYRIYIMTPDRSEERLLAGGNFPDWSHDGKRIAYTSNFTGQYKIYLIDYDGGNITELPPIVDKYTHPDWSPDDKKIVFVVDDEIRIFDLVRSITTNIPRSKDHSSEIEPVWSPNGTQILFIGEYFENQPNVHTSDIFTMDAEGENRINLTKNSDCYIFLSAAWSPDGEKIAFFCYADESVHLMNSDGSEETELYGPLYEPGRISWSMDGKWILIPAVSEDEMFYFLEVISIDGKKHYRMVYDAHNSDWAPVKLDF